MVKPRVGPLFLEGGSHGHVQTRCSGQHGIDVARVCECCTRTWSGTAHRSTDRFQLSLLVQADPNLSDEEKVKNAIDTYFRLRYEEQKLLETQDFSFLLTDQSQQWVQKEKDRREIELYRSMLYRLNYLEYKYLLAYNSIQVENNSATVNLTESNSVVHAAIAPQVSAMGGLEHVIKLSRTKMGWTIASDEYQDEFTEVLASVPKNTFIERIRLEHEAELRKAAGSKTFSPLKDPLSITSLTLHSYDRTGALNYANKYGYWQGSPGWVANRNPNYYDFENAGGDCTNYASQVIHDGGGAVMNYNQWYYTDVNHRSASWTGVGYLYAFLVNNTGTGPHGFSTDQCTMDPGDIIQLYNGSWYHSLVVVWSSHPTSCYNADAITVNTHINDWYHKPLSYWSGITKRYIGISGWYN